MNAAYRAIIRSPWLVVAVVAGATIVLGLGALRLRVDSSVTTLLPRGDPAKQRYDEVVERFGADEVDIIGIVADDVLAPETLQKISTLTKRAAAIKGVANVISLTNVRDPIADVLNPPLLIPKIPETAEAREALRARIKDNPLFAGNLIAPDSRGAAVNIFLADDAYDDVSARRIDGALEQLVAEVGAGGPEKLYLTGLSHIKVNALALMRRDLGKLTPASLALVVLVLFFSFRTRRGVVLPLLCVLVGVVWTMGIMGWLGEPISLGTLVLPSLLIVIGSSYATHVVARYYLEIEAPTTPGEPAYGAMQQAGLPVLVSAISTVIGFSALMLNPIQAVRSLGLFAVIGIIILFLLAMTLVPALILILPERRYRHTVRGEGERGRLPKILAKIARLDIRHRLSIFVVAAVLVLAALAALPRIEADTNFLSYFTPDSPIVRSHEAINDRVAGALPFYVVLGTPEKPGAMLTMESLRRVRDLEGFIDTIPGVTRAVSITDYLDLLDRGLRSSGDVILDDEGNPIDPSTVKPFWDDPKRTDEVLLFVKQNPGAFRSVITKDFSQTNILVRTRFERSRQIAAAIDQIRDFGEKNFPPDTQPLVTGNIVLLNGTTDDVVWGQVKSITIALIVIFIVMSLLFLSVKVGFIAMVPNVVPIALFFGVLGWGHVSLNIGTSIIAAIALGITVDNTIHFMVRFNRELQLTYDQEGSLTTALRTVGRPIVYTSLALTCGFFVMRLSEFVPVRDFGVLTAATMLAALGTNMFLLPALLAQTRIVTLWDLLFVKLGKDPHLTIPLFRGLRRAQARIAVLLGTLQTVAAGHAAVRQGEEGESMYVIVKGRADVIVTGTDGQRRLVQHLDRGDVFGEMGLIRRQHRTADIIAVDELELLAVDERFLQRLQRRYPRIAATVFLNLARILSDKLESTTGRFAAAS